MTTFNAYLQQYSCPPELRAEISKGPVPMIEYDGHAEVLAESLEALKAMKEDEFYIKTVAPDELKFLDATRAVQSIGYETIWVDEAKKG